MYICKTAKTKKINSNFNVNCLTITFFNQNMFFRAVALGCLLSSEWSEWRCSLHISTNNFMQTISELTHACVFVFQ